jgi:hypothetical protein
MNKGLILSALIGLSGCGEKPTPVDRLDCRSIQHREGADVWQESSVEFTGMLELKYGELCGVGTRGSAKEVELNEILGLNSDIVSDVFSDPDRVTRTVSLRNWSGTNRYENQVSVALEGDHLNSSNEALRLKLNCSEAVFGENETVEPIGLTTVKGNIWTVDLSADSYEIELEAKIVFELDPGSRLVRKSEAILKIENSDGSNVYAHGGVFNTDVVHEERRVNMDYLLASFDLPNVATGTYLDEQSVQAWVSTQPSWGTAKELCREIMIEGDESKLFQHAPLLHQQALESVESMNHYQVLFAAFVEYFDSHGFVLPESQDGYNGWYRSQESLMGYTLLEAAMHLFEDFSPEWLAELKSTMDAKTAHYAEFARLDEAEDEECLFTPLERKNIANSEFFVFMERERIALAQNMRQSASWDYEYTKAQAFDPYVFESVKIFNGSEQIVLHNEAPVLVPKYTRLEGVQSVVEREFTGEEGLEGRYFVLDVDERWWFTSTGGWDLRVSQKELAEYVESIGSVQLGTGQWAVRKCVQSTGYGPEPYYCLETGAPIPPTLTRLTQPEL